MKFSVDRLLLSEAVSNLSRAVAQKSSIPVLEGIYFLAENNILKMYAFNMEVGMSKEIEIRCETEGSIVISARIFGEMIRRMSGNFVTITVDDRFMCKIESDSAIFEIIGMPSTDYPEMPVVEDANIVKIPCAQMRDMVRQTIFAVATNDTVRPVLTGVLFEIYKDVISLTAVDGYRLAIRKENTNGDFETSFIASGKAILETVKLFGEKDEFVEIAIGKRHISILVDGYTITSRLLEGEFVNYQQSMPTEFKVHAKIKVKEVISIIERISLIINEQIKTPIRCCILDDKITFSCTTALGRVKDSCDAEIEGEGFEIGFNSRFLLEAMKATESEEVIWCMNGPLSPMIINPIEKDEFLYMVMPMRLKAENNETNNN